MSQNLKYFHPKLLLNMFGDVFSSISRYWTMKNHKIRLNFRILGNIWQKCVNFHEKQVPKLKFAISPKHVFP